MGSLKKAQEIENAVPSLTDQQLKSLDDSKKGYMSSIDFSISDFASHKVPVSIISNKRKTLASSFSLQDDLSEFNSTLDHTCMNLPALEKINLNDQTVSEKSTQIARPSKKIKLSQKSSQKSVQ